MLQFLCGTEATVDRRVWCDCLQLKAIRGLHPHEALLFAQLKALSKATRPAINLNQIATLSMCWRLAPEVRTWKGTSLWDLPEAGEVVRQLPCLSVSRPLAAV